MTIEEFKEVYLRLCKDHHIESQECVLSALSSSQKQSKKGKGHCLNLSTHSLTVKTCAVLGKALATDRTFTEIRFNDCMIPEEGIRAIAHGLSQNVACRKLDLKGNNIRGTGTEALGRMLKQNKTIISLCLEWNAMGMIDTAFGVFCEALGSNSRLQVLDMRNNQITHDGATDLGVSLKRNSFLRVLDMRWNNIGLIGGRQLLTALDGNHTLVKLELAGNNTPNDILKAIDSAVAHNSDRVSLENDFQTRQHMLSKEIQDLRKSRVSELAGIMDKADRQEASMRKSNRSAVAKVTQLQDALEERKDQFNTCASKLAMAESELALSESKINELSSLFSKAKEEQVVMNKQHQSELKRDREERALVEAKMTREHIELNDKTMQQENQIDELERKCKHQQEQIFELKEQLTHAHADYKLKQGQYEDKLQYERQKGKDAVKDLENSKNREFERLKRESEDNDRLHQERVNRMESNRVELEEDISRLKTGVAEERLRCEQHIMEMRQKVKGEEEQKVHALEEKMRTIQTTKDEMISHSTQQNGIISDLQTKNANLVLENETLRRRNEDLQQEISGKNSEIMAEVGKAKIELTQKIQRLETERQTQAELYDKVARLEKELSELKTKHTVSCTEKDSEIVRLKERCKMKESELRQIKEDEVQRASMLQAAINSYVNRTPPSTPR